MVRPVAGDQGSYDGTGTVRRKENACPSLYILYGDMGHFPQGEWQYWDDETWIVIIPCQYAAPITNSFGVLP